MGLSLIKLSRQNKSMSDIETWYVVKQRNGQCSILLDSDVEVPQVEPLQVELLQKGNEPSSLERWGPYASQQEAIARRVGLIRAGKCQPA